MLSEKFVASVSNYNVPDHEMEQIYLNKKFRQSKDLHRAVRMLKEFRPELVKQMKEQGFITIVI